MTTQSNQSISEILVRLAAAEARIAALEARQTITFITPAPPPAIPVSDPQCPYCYQPLSRCRGHNICESRP